MSAQVAELSASLRRIAVSTGPSASSPDLRAATALATRITSGGSPSEALRSLRGAAAVARFVERAGAPDLPRFLDGTATALSAHRRRAAIFERSSIYATLLAITSAVQALLLFEALGSLRLLAGTEYRPEASVSAAPAVIAVAISVVALLALAWDLRRRGAGVVLAGAKRQHLRALGLGLASAAIQGQTPLVRALDAAAAAVDGGQVSRELTAVAASLDRGGADPAASARLFGPLGGRLFAVAAARGEGEATLQSLAALEDRRAELALPLVSASADAVALLIAGVAIAATGAAFFVLYGRGLIGG